MKTAFATALAAGALLLGAACGQETIASGSVEGPTTEPTPGPTDGPEPCPTSAGDESSGDPTCPPPTPAPNPGPDPGPDPDPGPNPDPGPDGSDRPSIEQLYDAFLTMEPGLTGDGESEELATCMSELLYHSAMSDEALWSAVHDDVDYELSDADEAALAEIEAELMDCYLGTMDAPGN